jgi:hypothetical protein
VKKERRGKKIVEKKTFKKLYTKFFGGKTFTVTRVVFSSKNSQLASNLPNTCVTKNFEMWVVHAKNVGV